MKKKGGPTFLGYVGRGLLEIVKFPYYYVRWAYGLGKKISEKSKEIGLERKRRRMGAKYEEFKVVRIIEGDYSVWIDGVAKSDSQIGIILGARGTGKTAFGVKLLENLYSKYGKKCFAMGFKKEEMPSWIEVVEDVKGIENDSVVLIDEGGVLFGSRSSMSSANKLLSSLMMVARHKNISIIFISQNSSNLEVNILRQADFLALKPSSLLQKDFERRIVQKIYEETAKDFKKFDGDKGLAYVYSGKFRGFVSNGLPSFWKVGVSKGFA